MTGTYPQNDVFCQIFAKSGDKIGPEFRVNTHPHDAQGGSVIAKMGVFS